MIPKPFINEKKVTKLKKKAKSPIPDNPQNFVDINAKARVEMDDIALRKIVLAKSFSII